MDLVNTASLQKYSPKMADVIESYMVGNFIFVSLLLFCSHFCYFETIPVITEIYIIDDVMFSSAENYYFGFFLWCKQRRVGSQKSSHRTNEK